MSFVEMIPLFATASTTLFAGAALYINVAEHPARLQMDTAHAVEQWAPSYHRATMLQAPLAVLGFISGITCWILGDQILWLLGALLIGAVVPYTFIVVMPTNQKLLSPDLNRSSEQARALLVRWGRLHAVRTVLSFMATGLFLWLVSQRGVPT